MGGGPAGASDIWITQIYQLAFGRQRWGAASAYSVILFIIMMTLGYFYVRALSGTVVVDRAGRFRFEGPYPASYEGQPPHIHLRVVAPAHATLLSRYEPARGARRGSIRLVLVPQAV